LTVALAREAAPHLRPHALDLPTGPPALGRDDAVGADLVPDVEVVALAVELGVCECLLVED
jgi:hypothetical protein